MLFFLLFLGYFTPSTIASNTLPDDCGLLPNVDTLILQSRCGEDAILCTNIVLGQEWRYRFRQNGILIEPNLGCDFDTIRFYSPINEEVFSNDFAPFFVNNWQVDEQSFSGEFLSVFSLVDSLNTWDNGGNWQFDPENDRVFGGNSNKTYSALTIEILLTNSTIVSEYNVKVIAQKVGIPLASGDHQISVTDLANRCTQELVAKVVCTTIDTIYVSVGAGERRTLCFGGEELLGEIKNLDHTAINPQAYSWRPVQENCIEIRGKLNGVDSTHVVVCDEFGICDSTLVVVSIRANLNRQQQLVVRLGNEDEFCTEMEDFSLPGELTVFENTCPNDAIIATFELNESSLCVRYQGLQEGKDQACIRLCDNFGNCDSVDLMLTVVKPEIIFDTIFIDIETGTYCLDAEMFTGIINMQEDCEISDDIDRVQFEIDPKILCIEYVGKAIGNDSTCIWLVDEAGNASLTIFYITVVEASASTMQDSIFINETVYICVDTTELPGNINEFYNICPLQSGEKADFFIVSDYCVEVTGLALGAESACLVLCDDFGFCDTTYLNLRIVPYDQPPILRDDSTTTNQTEQVNIQVQKNDDLIGGVNVISIGNPPKYGSTIINEDGSITYFPDKQSCIGTDQFTYLLCNDGGCSNATVYIEVICDQLEIFSGMSPNEDGINDFFFISNIESQPNNRLQIFNRWGHLVYEAENYQNDWAGTWHGKLLPDGTYFYILEVESAEGEKVYRGSVELHR